jgi:hypothetical protein
MAETVEATGTLWHICELTLVEHVGITVSKSDATFSFSDSTQCGLLQVELELAQSFEVSRALPGVPEGSPCTDGQETASEDAAISFRVILSNKKEMLRLLATMKMLKWDVLTSVAYSTSDTVVKTFYYSCSVPHQTSGLGMEATGDLGSGVATELDPGSVTAATSQEHRSTSNSTKKPRKSISQRFVSLLTPSFAAGSGKMSTDSSANSHFAQAPAAENSAHEDVPNTDAAASDLEIGDEALEEQLLAGEPLLGADNSNVNDMLEVLVEKCVSGDSAASDDLQTSIQTPTSANESPAVIGTPNSRKMPRKSLSQRFGSLLSPSKSVAADSTEPTGGTVVAEPEKHDNPILQRFKTKSEDAAEETGQGL